MTKSIFIAMASISMSAAIATSPRTHERARGSVGKYLRVDNVHAIKILHVPQENRGLYKDAQIATGLAGNHLQCAQYEIRLAFYTGGDSTVLCHRHLPGQKRLAINNARRVFCMGVGGSSANIAIEAQTRLFRYDVVASSIIDPYIQQIDASICEC